MILRRYIIKVLAILTIATQSSCNSTPEFFEFIPLESYRFDEAGIGPGTKVRILAYAGGVKNEHEKIYYSQFFCVVEPAGDTIIIISPMIGYNKSESDTSKVHSPVIAFNPPMEILTASYSLIDSSTLEMMVRAELFTADNPGKMLTADDLLKKGGLQHLVVTNKRMPEFNTAKYKAAVGFLYFKKSPL